MSSSRRNSNRKVVSLNKLNRVLGIDCLEDRRLMTANLNGYYTDRNYFKAFPGQQAVEVAPATSVRDTSARQTVSPKFEATPAVESEGNAAANQSTNEQPAAGLKGLGAQPAGKTAPTSTNATPATSTITPAPAAQPSVKQALVSLKTRTLSKPQDESTYSGEAHVLELQNTDVATSGEWGSAAYQGTTRVLTVSGKVKLEDDASKGKLSAKAEGDASLFKTDHHGQYATPDVLIGGKTVATTDYKANATVLVGVSGSAEAGVNWNSKDFGLNGKANVFAGVEAKGDASQESRVLGVKTAASAEGYARAGAEASAEGSIGAKGVEAKAGAFAGVKTGGNVKSSIAGIGVGLEGEAWAGAGAEAEFATKMEDGKFKMKVAAGAAELVGAKGGFTMEVDPSEVAKLADLSDEVEGVVAEIKASQEAQAFAAKAQADAAQAQADAQAALDQVLAQMENFQSMTSNWNSQASSFANDVGSQFTTFGSTLGSLFG